jgi:hypothetical protein
MTIKSIQAAVDGSTSTFVRSDGTAAAAGGGGPATSLDTTGAAVNVGSSAPPTTGDVLTATSATTATWQAPSGGSGLSSPQVLARGLGA